jgi:hypothetical protein
MQSENELAEAAEKAAVEKDLEKWELSAEKERAAAQFYQEKGNELREDLIADLNSRKTTYPHTLTLDGQHKNPIIQSVDFDEGKRRILEFVASVEERALEPLKQAYLDEQKETRDLETKKQQEQQKTAEQVQQPRLRLGQQPSSERYRELREQTQKYKDENIKEQQAKQDLERREREETREAARAEITAPSSPNKLEPMHPAEHKQRQEERAAREEIREAAKAEIRQPMRMTDEAIDRAVKEAKAQLERSKEQGLDYGRGL